MMTWACCVLLCGMCACSDNDGGSGEVNGTSSGYGRYSHGYDGTLTETTADGRIAGLPNDLGPSWGQGETDVWDGTADVSWYTGEDDFYYITTAEQLAGLSVLTNSGENFSEVTVVLGVNVILNERIEMDKEYNVLNTDDLKPWQPIYGFRGDFDGRGHVISGLYIDMEYSDNVGLFGDAKYTYGSGYPGDICNLGIVNSYIRGNHYVSAIAGDFDGSIRHCFSTAVVVGKGDNVCGIGADECFQCFHKGVVISEGVATGISSATNCYNAGIVMGKDYAMGIGLFGNNYNLYLPDKGSIFYPIDYTLYSEDEDLDLRSVIATFADNSGVLTARPNRTLPDGVTTLVEALNCDEDGEPVTPPIWIVDPERNNGYPVFAQDLYYR